MKVGLVWTAVVALGFGAMACGSTSPAGAGDGGPTGGAGTGGTPAGDAAVKACTEFTPCGGNLVGAWQSDPVCLPSTLSGIVCQGETFDVTGVVTTTTWTFRADKTLSLALSVAGPAKVEVNETCLARRGNGQTVTCTDASAGALYAMGISFPGGKVGGSTCQPGASGICACTITFVPDPGSIAGTYSATGTTIDTGFNGDLAAFDYCVSGTALKLRGHPTDPNETPKVGLYHKQ